MFYPVGACGSRSSLRGTRSSAWTLKEAQAVPRFDRASEWLSGEGKKIRFWLSPVRRRPVREVLSTRSTRRCTGGQLELGSESQTSPWRTQSTCSKPAFQLRCCTHQPFMFLVVF